MRVWSWRHKAEAVLYVAAAAVFSFSFGKPFHTPKVLVLAVLATWLGFRARSARRMTPLVLFVVLWPLATAFWSVNPRLFWEALTPWALYVFILLVAVPLQEDERLRLRVGLAWAGLLAAAYVTLQKLGVDWVRWELGAPAGGFFGNPNFTAHFLLLALCLGRFPEKSSWRWLGYGGLAVGVVLCASRGVWLGAAAFAAFALLRARPKLGPAIALASVAILLALSWRFRADLRQGFAYLTSPQAYLDDYRGQPRLIVDRDPWFRGKRLSLATRVILAGNSLAMVGDRPVHGVGLGQFHVHYPRYARSWVDDPNLSADYRAASAHNLLLDGAIQFGLPWLLAAGWLAARLWRRTRDDRQYWLAVALQAGVAMVSLNYLNPVIVATLILLLPLPSEPEAPSRNKVRWLWLFAPFLAALGALDYLAGQASRVERATALFPAERARAFHGQGLWREAWLEQARAFRRDPYGPETLYNLGLAAWEAAAHEGQAWREAAIAAWLQNRRFHPFYQPAARRLASVDNGPYAALARRERERDRLLSDPASRRDIAARVQELDDSLGDP